MILQTQRLRLRTISEKDKAAIFSYRSDKIANQFQGWIPKNLLEVEEFIQKTAKEENLPHTWFQLVIIVEELDKVIGDIGIHFMDDENKQVEIGCTLDKNFQKKGYASEALKRLIEYLFNDLGKHRITTSIDPHNLPSIKLMQRLGFRKEAHFIESLYLNGTWVDDMVFALLAREWN